jgi:hypothetical protein
MNLSDFDRFVWAASLYGQALLVLILWTRGRAKSFPIFTAYIGESICTNIALYFTLYHRSLSAYAHAYHALGFVDEALQLLVVYELAIHVFCPTGVWARDARKIFLGLAGVSFGVAFLLTWLAHPAGSLPIDTFLLRSNFFSAALMSELFVGMMVLSVTVGLPWKTHVARIAQGLGAYSVFCVAKNIALAYVDISKHPRVFTELSHLRILTYLACEAYWVVMLWQEAPAPRELPDAMRAQIYTLQKQVEYDLIRIRAWRKN